MDGVLCDEVLQEILQRLPPSAFPSVSLVSKRWLSLLRSSITTLCLRIPSFSPPPPPPPLPSISSVLSHYPSLSTLTLLLLLSETNNHNSYGGDGDGFTHPLSADSLLLSLAASNHRHRRLRHLRFLAGPVSPSALVSLSLSSPFRHLTALKVSSLHPLSFCWLSHFPSLRDLSVVDCSGEAQLTGEEEQVAADEESAQGLPLEALSLSGIRAGNHGLGWLWRRCPNLLRLQLRACEGTGDGPASPSFVLCLPRLRELELRTCRAIADHILLLIADHCRSLASLLLYDGGSRDGLHRFIRQCGPTLRTLDLRLPLDLDNGHLSAVAENFRSLTSLRLQSCCLVTGEGLTSLGRAAAGAAIEELVLINCDVIEREPGLLTYLGQNLSGLRRLDLSYNEMLLDKELVSMLASCRKLIDIRLRGCRELTDAVVHSISKCCELLEIVDVTRCFGISTGAVEFFILNSPRLSRILVEESKVSESASACASRKAIQFC